MSARAEPVLACALGGPLAPGRIRRRPEDFEVCEELGYVPEGTGQHVWLRLRKHLLNTEQVARELARYARRPRTAVGYAGLKDRHAVAEQWFSVDLAGAAEPDWGRLDVANIEVLEATRHPKKLRRGGLAANRFCVRVRDIDIDHQSLAHRLMRMRDTGVPNYFGAQRFGRDGNNIDAAYRMLAGGVVVRDRHLRGMYLSAARALLFNTVLSVRVSDGSWNQVLAGDVMMLEGTHSIFPAQTGDTALIPRLQRFDIHPTGPLWGRGPPPTRDEALAVERRALREYADLQRGLESFGLKHERRALRLKMDALGWAFEEPGRLRLNFALPRGAYATAVLRELVDVAGR